MRQLRYYHPELKTFNKSFDHLLFGTDLENRSKKIYKPAVDITEAENQFTIHLSVPGIKKEDFKIELENDQLVVSGERKVLDSDVSVKYHKMQTEYGKFKQLFQLPENVDRDQINAKQEDGILQIELKKIKKNEKKSLIEVR